MSLHNLPSVSSNPSQDQSQFLRILTGFINPSRDSTTLLRNTQYIDTVVLFSGACLIYSCFNYVFQSLSLILPPFHRRLTANPQFQIISFALIVISFLGFLLVSFLGRISRRCERKGCKGVKKAPEFDLQVQGEELLRNGDGNKAVRDVNELPWKGGSEDDPFYECLRVELRKMAPRNGRAVLLFREECGCPVAKIEGWRPRRGDRRHKNQALSSGGK